MTHGVGRDAGTRFLAAGDCSTLERESILGLLASKCEPSGNYERNHRSGPGSARDRKLAFDPGSAFTHPEESKMPWSSVL
jgi:hypothetical protein